MLGLGRALGETMAVTFIIGNTYQLDSASLYMPGNSITSALANEFAEAESGLHVAALMELGLILFVITFIVLAASKFMIMRRLRMRGTLMAMVEMQTTAALAESRRKCRRVAASKPYCADALDGDDGLRPVLADLDFNVHHHSRYRRYVAGAVH